VRSFVDVDGGAGIVSRPATGLPRGRVVALGCGVLANVLLVALVPRHGPSSVGLVVVATAICGALAIVEGRRPRLGGRLVAGAIVVVMAVAVITPPLTSNDLWSYGTYGRMVVAHDTNPYTATPSQFPHDPMAQRVSAIWMHRSSVYGPVWIGVAAADAAIVGRSPLGNRLFFQLLAALAATAVLVLVWRRTKSTATILWLGLNPAFLAVAVNGGHADLLMGLAILGAALCAARGRGWVAGLLIGLAALVKLTALLALVGIVLWAWRARRTRVLVGAAVGTFVTMVVGYAAIFRDAARVISSADHTVTAGSPWNGLADLLLGHDARRTVAHPLAPDTTLEVIAAVGLGLVAVLALLLGWRAARARDPRLTAGVTTASYTLGASYSFPWYANWSLPSVADAPPSPIAWVIWLQAPATLAALKMRVHSTGIWGDGLFRVLLTDVVPLALLVAFVVYGLRTASGRQELQPPEHDLEAAAGPDPAGSGRLPG
jgi:hypothetical protein